MVYGIMRRFYIEPSGIQRNQAVLSGSDARHIQSVLRMKPGDRMILFNGKGLEYLAEIVAVSKGRVEVSLLDQYASETESGLRITLAQGMLKDKKMDALIRHLTELGITRWVPFFAERSVPRPDAGRLSARMARWHKIAVEALKQCGRGVAPDILHPLPYADVLDLGSRSGLPVVFWENATEPVPAALGSAAADQPEDIFLMMGPEGGFAPQEIDAAKGAGFHVASLGPRILRAETATLAACTVMQYVFGDMGAKKS